MKNCTPMKKIWKHRLPRKKGERANSPLKEGREWTPRRQGQNSQTKFEKKHGSQLKSRRGLKKGYAPLTLKKSAVLWGGRERKSPTHLKTVVKKRHRPKELPGGCYSKALPREKLEREGGGLETDAAARFGKTRLKPRGNGGK